MKVSSLFTVVLAAGAYAMPTTSEVCFLNFSRFPLILLTFIAG